MTTQALHDREDELARVLSDPGPLGDGRSEPDPGEDRLD